MNSERKQHLRELPSANLCLDHPEVRALLRAYPRQRVVSAVRMAIGQMRIGLLQGQLGWLSRNELLVLAVSQVRTTLLGQACEGIQRVINATGIILHTNLGRAVLPEVSLEALVSVGRGYSNLELDLTTGKRSSRQAHVEGMLAKLTGAEAALVVNNNAAAVFLCLHTLANGKEVVVSRGEQIEIGDSFRIPDVIRQTGAKLVEVGTTNRTYLSDYANAITASTMVLLKVQRSNFHMVGFVASVSCGELAALARSRGLISMEDLGSGNLADLSRFGLRAQPTVNHSISEGIDLVTFSGDKLLGGPQAGIIVGRRHLVQRLAKNPIVRIMRIDKLTIAALEALLELYLDDEGLVEALPVLSMLALTQPELEARAVQLASLILDNVNGKGNAAVIDAEGEMGGGAMPGIKLPGKAVAFRPGHRSAHQIQTSLRLVGSQPPGGCLLPVVALVDADQVVFHLRTLLPGDEAEIVKALAVVMGGPST
ncbi:MAG: L-seryl-tRNA(Sec) selenium transferase [Firmicutes bacterium]|nr:L-seryl-tRNA(Sec) selenium transferase [Bacillota bacterium]